ncbi:aromatic ring-hydroxylating dioxygenase subunit alpha [Ideonella sp. A 288]|uniref:aromatic ring-hydroxylating dioxygenase subunit alpha n=1 Tax=Ideonella sp. A 288 TaxID=1962181 RepID=UPI000B4BB2C5|nr:aromatic ring-hydroxylating dioxygenase subunit alpha [Ideonella sp. A 288]
MNADQNDLITRIGPGTPCGQLMRHYWHPVALLDEFDPRLAQRPVKAVRVLGQDLVLFRDGDGRWGLLDRDCPHRGADLAFGRHEPEGLRCPFHGWKFATDGRCLETPAEGLGSTLCQRVRQRSYPVRLQSGVLFGWFGDEGSTPGELPHFDCFAAPASHSFAFKGLWHCNWLQAFEVGIDPSHASFLHRFLQDESLDAAYGRQFRGASAGTVDGERWPMTRVLREFHSPEIRHEALADGLVRLTTLRAINDALTHVRITNAVFPYTFVIPLSETITITQLHVPVDDTHTYWYSFFTSFDAPLDKEAMRSQRLQGVSLPDYVPFKSRDNQWGFDPEEQRTRTYLGMGEHDINVHDQWAVESMGAIQDRTREHLGTSDKVIMANRRLLLQAIETVRAGGTPPMVLDAEAAARLHGPDTIDCIAPAQGWQAHWAEAAAAKRAGAAWLQAAGPASAAPSASTAAEAAE